jgi:PAS domain S-box-containing protein
LIRIRGRRPRSTEIQGEQIMLTVDEAPIAVAVFDRDMRYLAASRRWIEDYGLQGQDVIGQVHYELFPDLPERWKEAHRRGMAGESGSMAEDPFLRPDGSEQWIRWDVQPWRDDEGAVGGITLFAEDITARKVAEQALAHAGRLEAVGRLAGGVAHDFNNLLAVIDGNLQLAGVRVEDARTKALLERAGRAVQDAASFTRRLLSLVKKQPLEPHRLRPNAEVIEAVNLLQSAVGAGVGINLALAKEVWEVECDPAELDSALLNLAMNGRDAMNGHGALTISTANVVVTAAEAARWPGGVAGDYVRITVEDTGVGMSPEVLRRAREPFYTTKAGGRGTGLGLTSVSAFLKESGGFLALDSASGRGAKASLYLPRGRGKAPAFDARPAGPPLGEGQRVLLVDDDDAVREVLWLRLDSLGYAVTEARSGAEALAVLDRGEPVDLVLSDVVMSGGMSGYALAEKVRASHPATKVILISGATLDLGEEAAADLVVLPKPCPHDLMAQAIHEALHEGETNSDRTS